MLTTTTSGEEESKESMDRTDRSDDNRTGCSRKSVPGRRLLPLPAPSTHNDDDGPTRPWSLSHPLAPPAAAVATQQQHETVRKNETTTTMVVVVVIVVIVIIDTTNGLPPSDHQHQHQPRVGKDFRRC
jgi:hypothetical protein